ncbi:MAG: 2-oxo acid dehydrogenase subunit E2 [Sphingobacteriales bacterium]|nr:MAG: 2-oxo acid dehydrogenase subunit E2 [Sphingobacteriales bacterium]
MAKQVELIMPKMGESIAEATILKWLKQEGETIELDESVLEIATDKVDSEVPSPISGTLIKILHPEGAVVLVGKAVAMIALAGEGEDVAGEPSPNGAQEAQNTQNKTAAASSSQQNNAPSAQPQNLDKSEASRFYSPLVLNIARSEGISMSELENLSGTGKEGRVTKKDILDYVENRGSAPQSQPQTQTQATQNTQAAPQQSTSSQQQTQSASQYKVDVSLQPGDEIIEMDRMRKIIAENMVMSKHVSPHVTSFVEADVTNMVKWRDKIKKDFEKKEGEKITFTPIFIEAVVKAIKDFPNINVALGTGDKIIKRKSINIGMAAALPSGNLIVPVIKNADTKNLLGLTKEVNDLAGRARSNKLKPDDIQGATFTLTNVGTFGNVMGTPIIPQPQVAIMAVGAIKKKPVVIETEYGDIIAIRHMMFLSLSYDHRVVDGMLGGSFLRKVADYLEAFEIDRQV